MTILRTGTTQKYSENWEIVFGKKNATKKKTATRKKTVAKGKKTR